jgi:hypothetical protein
VKQWSIMPGKYTVSPTSMTSDVEGKRVAVNSIERSGSRNVYHTSNVLLLIPQVPDVP